MAGFSKSPGLNTPNQGGSKPPPSQKPKEQGGPSRTKFTTPKGSTQNKGVKPTPVGGSGTTVSPTKPFRAK